MATQATHFGVTYKEVGHCEIEPHGFILQKDSKFQGDSAYAPYIVTKAHDWDLGKKVIFPTEEKAEEARVQKNAEVDVSWHVYMR